MTDPRNHLCHCGAWGSFGVAGAWLCFAHWSMTAAGQTRLSENMETVTAQRCYQHRAGLTDDRMEVRHG